MDTENAVAIVLLAAACIVVGLTAVFVGLFLLGLQV